ncbi:phage tail protein, partial [Xanthomonas maliensis]|uniref:phage tail protein n=2 Tax=Xanthomonas maliensis TaxID=1321368 RepID=UPI00068D53C0
GKSMAVSLPNGALIFIASGYAAASNITAASNASPSVATAANTLAAGDFVEVTSGWSRLTSKIVRVASPTSSQFAMEGIDATNTAIYPAGSGGGTFRKVSAWTQIAQILSSASDGGEQQFLTYQFLESDSEKRMPTVKSASGLTFGIADDPSLAGYQVLSAANDDRIPRAVRILLPSGSVLLYNAYVSLNKTPSLTVNQIMAVQATLSLLAEPVRYAL